jgi:murein DD-endopeptidase MepM/ murein hydrolase activator NlpD
MDFHPVIHLAPGYTVWDFSKGADTPRVESTLYGVGRYNEHRPAMYTSELFSGVSGVRDIHMGIDLFAPVGSPLFAFSDGVIHSFAYHAAPGDYGATLVTRHQIDELTLYALYGHLSRSSIESKVEGQLVKKGETLAWVGDRNENGGWTPHLHFQLSFVEPQDANLPGVVSQMNWSAALLKYPDPRLVLGALY